MLKSIGAARVENHLHLGGYLILLCGDIFHTVCLPVQLNIPGMTEV